MSLLLMKARQIISLTVAHSLERALPRAWALVAAHHHALAAARGGGGGDDDRVDCGLEGLGGDPLARRDADFDPRGHGDLMWSWSR